MAVSYTHLALQLKEKYGATVTIISMGPPQATGMLKELYARGVDECILITDRKFAGADTCATSSTLAAALNKTGYDLIIAGRQAIDGDTACLLYTSRRTEKQISA